MSSENLQAEDWFSGSFGGDLIGLFLLMDGKGSTLTHAPQLHINSDSQDEAGQRS